MSEADAVSLGLSREAAAARRHSARSLFTLFMLLPLVQEAYL